MPFGMGWLVDVRNLILENPLWMFLIFLLIVKYRLMIEKNMKQTEIQNSKEQFDNTEQFSNSFDDNFDFDDDFDDDFNEKPKKWYQKLFKKKN